MVFDKRKMLPVLAGITLVALPLLMKLNLLITGVTCLLGFWAYCIVIDRCKQPGAILRTLILVAGCVSIVVAYGSIFGQIAGTSLLLYLSMLKIFEARAPRDIYIIVFMGYFLIASNFFFSQSPVVALYACLCIIYLTSVLVLLNDRTGGLRLRSRVVLSSRMFGAALPFMLILFVLFPRIPSPLWGLPEDANAARTGLSEDLTPGVINNLVTSAEVAFRVSFQGEPPAAKDLYWRGPVLSHYDGKTWRRNDAPPETNARIIDSEQSSRYIYKVTLEPHDKHWLLALEYPSAHPNNMRFSREAILLSRKPVRSVVSYTLSSDTRLINTGLFEEERSKNLQLPAGYNPRTIALGRSLRQQYGNDARTISSSIHAQFRDEGFIYTLTPPLLGVDAMDDFLFDSKQGFCGHFASAYVSLMRAAGIPTRVVIGYQGGSLNPFDGHMVVRQSDAHAWAEIWVEGYGWQRVDPTGAVSPSRIESGITNAGLESNRLPSLIVTDLAILRAARDAIDSLQNSWNNWVVGYDDEKQRELFRRMGFGDIDSGTLMLWLVIMMTVAGIAVSVVLLKDTVPDHRDRAARAYDVFCSRFTKHGLKRSASQGEEEFLVSIRERFPDSAREAERITRSYQQIRYNDRDDPRFLKNFITVAKSFRVRIKSTRDRNPATAS